MVIYRIWYREWAGNGILEESVKNRCVKSDIKLSDREVVDALREELVATVGGPEIEVANIERVFDDAKEAQVSVSGVPKPKAKCREVAVNNEKLKFIDLADIEKSRTYFFENNMSLTIFDVVRICVRPSGAHRLETRSGEKWIIPPRWNGIKIDANRWSC